MAWPPVEPLVAATGGDSGLTRVSFTHAGCEVTVGADGRVTVTE